MGGDRSSAAVSPNGRDADEADFASAAKLFIKIGSCAYSISSLRPSPSPFLQQGPTLDRLDNASSYRQAAVVELWSKASEIARAQFVRLF